MSRTDPMGLPAPADGDTLADPPRSSRRTDPGLSPALAHTTDVDPPRPAPVAPVPDDVLARMDEALGGRPRVRVVETPETHGENGARYAGVGAGVRRERVKTEPTANIIVAKSGDLPTEPGRPLVREASPRVVEDAASVDSDEDRERRRAPTRVSTHEARRRRRWMFAGVLVALVALGLVLAGILLGRRTETPAPNATATATATASTSVAPGPAPPAAVIVPPLPAKPSAVAPPSATAEPSPKAPGKPSAAASSAAVPAAPVQSAAPPRSAEPVHAPPSAPVAPLPPPSATISPELKGTF